jgi:RNA polymerase sigma-70 factor (ECF subfamily)
VLLLRDVLGFSGAEVAAALDTTPASVYSLLQRAHSTLDDRMPDRSQQATLRALGDARLSEIVDRYVDAWTRNDVGAIVGMLTESATLAMPPVTSWYRGRVAIAAALGTRPLDGRQRWRLLPTSANGQLALGAYRLDSSGIHVFHGVTVLTLRDEKIDEITDFPEVSPEPFGLPPRV